MIIYLYVKTHNITGLKYLGKTSKKDPHLYKGSGKYWIKHIEKHGYDVKTDILLVTEDANELKETGIFFSNLWNIVESSEWANLMLETGTGGSNSQNIDYKKLVATRKANGKTWIQTEESNTKRSKAHKGRKKSKETVNKWIETKRIRGILHLPTWTKESNPRAAENVSKALKGIKKTAEHISNMTFHENNKPIHQCPYCEKIGDLRNMKRWHFDRCKNNPAQKNDLDKTVCCKYCNYTANSTPNFYRNHNSNCKLSPQSSVIFPK